MPNVKIGVQIRPQHTTWADYEQAWQRADALGADSIWSWDHFFPLAGDPNGPHFEGWTALALLGPRVKATVGCLVMAMSYRNPALLSQMAKTLDHALGGRLVLGLGAGWCERDYVEYDYPFGTPGDRLRNLERGIKIIEERWRTDAPPPLNGRRVPILIGGSGEKVTLRLTAQYADIWNGFGPVDSFARKNAILNEWCAKVGRNPAEIERSVRIDPPEFDRLDDYVAAGATHFIMPGTAPFEFADLQWMIAWRDGR